MTDDPVQEMARSERATLLGALERLPREVDDPEATESVRLRALARELYQAIDAAVESVDRTERLHAAYRKALFEERVPAPGEGEDPWDELVDALRSADPFEEAEEAVERIPLAWWVDRWARRVRCSEEPADAHGRARRALVRVVETSLTDW